MKKWILLDRDGVINFDSDDYIKAPSEWLPIPGSLEAIANLNQAGFSVGVATNQSGIARGLYTLETLDAIHHKMNESIKSAGGHIEAIAYCPHGPNEGCECRKPKPGLLQHIANQFEFSLKNTYFIGDSLRDLQAALAVGATPILVRTGKGEKTISKNPDIVSDFLIFNDLLAASDYLIERDIA